MLPSQKKLLELLKKKAMSSEELVKKTGLSPDGIRGRISELHKQGFDIRKIDGKYRLILSDHKKHADQILKYVESQHLSGQKILISTLQESLKLTSEELTEALSEIFKQEKLIQISKNTIIIQK